MTQFQDVSVSSSSGRSYRTLSGGRQKFYPQEYIEYFYDYILSQTHRIICLWRIYPPSADGSKWDVLKLARVK